MINLVIDMMGGDNGFKATSEAVKEFLKDNDDTCLTLVGNKEYVDTFKDYKNVQIVYSETLLSMDVDPMKALKDEKSSLMVAIKELLDNDFDGIISAGSTGALLTAAIFKVKRIEGIKRPGLITSFPTLLGDKKTVVIDLGANLVNTAEELVQFAKLGKIYYSLAYKVENPAIYQLNNGTEEEKGRDINKEAFTILKNDSSLNFCGNIEARDVLQGNADVVVTDGFSGNIFLKATEGGVKAMSTLLKEAFMKNLGTKICYLLLRKQIKEMKKKMDYKNVGGAMLLGVNKIVVKAHGSSDAKAFLSALNLSKKLANDNIIEKIKGEIK